MDIKNYISELDSSRFGFKIAKVNDFDLHPETTLLFLKENGVKLVLSKVSLDNFKLINVLEKNNFSIKDIQVTYKFDLKNYVKNSLHLNSEYILRDAEQRDINELQEIATESFNNYGHYFEDEKLDRDKCNCIYSDWIKRSCESKEVADKIIVAEHKKKIIGFLSFKIYEGKVHRYGAGGIGAVAKEYRNKDVFKMITIEGFNWGADNNLDWEEHNVQINNYPVNRSFSKLGFKIYKSFVTMHNWI